MHYPAVIILKLVIVSSPNFEISDSSRCTLSRLVFRSVIAVDALSSHNFEISDSIQS